MYVVMFHNNVADVWNIPADGNVYALPSICNFQEGKYSNSVLKQIPTVSTRYAIFYILSATLQLVQTYHCIKLLFLRLFFA